MPIVHPDIVALKAKGGGKLTGGDHQVPAADFATSWGRHWDHYVDPVTKEDVFVRITRESEDRGQFGSEEDHDLSARTFRFPKGDASSWSTLIRYDLQQAKRGASLHPDAQGREVYDQIISRDKRKNRWDVYLVDPKDKKKGLFGFRVMGATENHDLSVSPIFAKDISELRQKVYDFEKSEPTPAPSESPPVDAAPAPQPSSFVKMLRLDAFGRSKAPTDASAPPSSDASLAPVAKGATSKLSPAKSAPASRQANLPTQHAPSWFASSWPWVAAGVVVVAGGGYVFYRSRRGLI